MRWFSVDPLDSLFFREGRPFNQGEGGGLRVEGLFPPAPTTVVGALRAALARGEEATRARGKEGAWAHGGWDEVLKAELGDRGDLRQLRFRGPYLQWGDTLYFPAPAHLQGLFEGEELRRVLYLSPGSPYQTDRGELRLPVPQAMPDPGLKPKELDAYWISREGLQKVLEGWKVCPEDLVHRSELWRTENRVGVQLIGKNAGENALYEAQHVRLQRSVRILVGLEGTDWNPRNPAPLGGESRAAWMTEVASPTFPEPKSGPGGKCVAILVTPVAISDMGDAVFCGGDVAGLGNVVSACLPKPIWIGGFDAASREPQPLQPYLPAGSVFFLDSLDHGFSGFIGSKSPWGYGQVLIGNWRSA